MSSLPTCWYCPECGRLFRTERKGHMLPLRHDSIGTNEVCPGTAVRGSFVAEGTPPEQILNLVGELFAGTPDELARRIAAGNCLVVIPREVSDA